MMLKEVLAEVEAVLAVVEETETLAAVVEEALAMAEEGAEVEVLEGKVKMARLTYKKRKGLRKSSFAIPSKRKYPIHDKTHAISALSMVAKYGTPAEKKQVRAAVHKRYPSIGKSRRKK